MKYKVTLKAPSLVCTWEVDASSEAGAISRVNELIPFDQNMQLHRDEQWWTNLFFAKHLTADDVYVAKMDTIAYVARDYWPDDCRWALWDWFTDKARPNEDFKNLMEVSFDPTGACHRDIEVTFEKTRAYLETYDTVGGPKYEHVRAVWTGALRNAAVLLNG